MGPGGAARRHPRAHPSWGLSRETVAESLDRVGRWSKTAIGYRGTGRQNRPECCGAGSQPDLGRGLSGFFVRVPAGRKQPGSPLGGFRRTSVGRIMRRGTSWCTGRSASVWRPSCRRFDSRSARACTKRTRTRLPSVVRGYFRCQAVPRNEERLKAFRHEVLRMWWLQLRRPEPKNPLDVEQIPGATRVPATGSRDSASVS